MTAQWKPIDTNIWFLPSGRQPLSAEVGLILGRERLWLYDTGASDTALNAIRALSQPPCVVLSHFHPDHISNWDRLDYRELYLGGYTFTKTGTGTVIDRETVLNDGTELRLIPLPSCHAKGSLALEVDGRYAFLGDGVYSALKRNRPAYNVTLLKDLIAVLKGLQASSFLLSHDQPFVQKKEDVLVMLEGVYAQRIAGCPDIFPE